jgi:3-oxoadipate enol-lactonase
MRMLAHDVEGNGAAALLLVHEGISDRRMWDPQVGPFVDAGYTVVRCDLRGFGDSELTPGPFSNVGDLHELLTHLGIDRAVLVGGSFGARVSLEYALTHPEGVDALVLIGPGLRDAEWSEAIEKYGEEEDALLEAGDVDGAVELNLRTWVDGPSRTPDEVDPAVRELARQMQRRAFDLQLPVPDAGPDEPFDPPASSRLEEIRCPVLIVVGDVDQPDILRVADRLAAGITGARREVIAGTAHMPSLERPDEFNRLVLDFLQAA